MSPFWDPATAITRSTRSADQLAAQAAREAAAEEAQKRRVAEIEALAVVLKISPLPIPD
jgi:hypothetical protein